jgi:hypothetical protein
VKKIAPVIDQVSPVLNRCDDAAASPVSMARTWALRLYRHLPS